MVLHMEHPREGKPPRCTVHRLDYSTYISPRPVGAQDAHLLPAGDVEPDIFCQQPLPRPQLRQVQVQHRLSGGHRRPLREPEERRLFHLRQLGHILRLTLEPPAHGHHRVHLLFPTLLRRIAEELLARRDLRAAYMSQDYADTLPLDRTPVEYLAPEGDAASETRARTYLGSIRYRKARGIKCDLHPFLPPKAPPAPLG